ncbi:hypothetical protein IIA95_01965 [Patescibacteria group bacterium]|nr:hypothetical protein [Patescibacteria group bacterium]
MTRKSRKRLFWLSTALFLLVSPPIILYTTGWRITEDFKIKRTGGLFVAVPESGTDVYLNGKLEKKTNFFQSGVFIQNLTPGIHSVLVAKSGFWPWIKSMPVIEQSVVEARALMVPQNIDGETVLKGSYEVVLGSSKHPLLLLQEKKKSQYVISFYLPTSDAFLKASSEKTRRLLSNPKPLRTVSWNKEGGLLLFDNQTILVSFDLSRGRVHAKATTSVPEELLPTLPHRIAFDERARARAWHGDSREIWVEWLRDGPLPYYFKVKKEMIFHTRSEIKNISFYPGRDDVILLAIENGVFALEIDGRGTRNFQPIYKGKDPTFARLDDAIYILDQGVLSKIEL